MSEDGGIRPNSSNTLEQPPINLPNHQGVGGAFIQRVFATDVRYGLQWKRAVEMRRRSLTHLLEQGEQRWWSGQLDRQ